MLKEFWSLGPNLTKYPGGFPNGFYDKVLSLLGPGKTLNVCSGSLNVGTCVDISFEALKVSRAPFRVVADCCYLPFKDGVFDSVIIDPPYSDIDAKKLYGCKYPKQWKLLAESKRVTRICGVVGLLHTNTITPGVVPGYKNSWLDSPKMKLIALIAVTIVKSQSRIRIFQVWKKG